MAYPQTKASYLTTHPNPPIYHHPELYYLSLCPQPLSLPNPDPDPDPEPDSMLTVDRVGIPYDSATFGPVCARADVNCVRIFVIG